MLVRYDCGCVGFPQIPGSTEAWIVECCSDKDLALFVRDMDGKKKELLTLEDSHPYLENLARFVELGHRYLELRHELKRMLDGEVP